MADVSIYSQHLILVALAQTEQDLRDLQETITDRRDLDTDEKESLSKTIHFRLKKLRGD